MFFFLCMFLANQRFIFLIFSSVAPHRGQPAAKCHPKVATNQKIGSQLWAGETPDSNPGLQDISLVCYHWATMPPKATMPPSQCIYWMDPVPHQHVDIQQWFGDAGPLPRWTLERQCWGSKTIISGSSIVFNFGSKSGSGCGPSMLLAKSFV